MTFMYKDLLPLVNDADTYARLLSYVDHRISNLRDSLEITTDPHRIATIQGQIAELRRLHTLRETAKHKAENKE